MVKICFKFNVKVLSIKLREQIIVQNFVLSYSQHKQIVLDLSLPQQAQSSRVIFVNGGISSEP